MVGAHRASDGRHPRLSDLCRTSPPDPSGPAGHDLRGIFRGAPGCALQPRQGPLPRLLLSAKFPGPDEKMRRLADVGGLANVRAAPGSRRSLKVALDPGRTFPLTACDAVWPGGPLDWGAPWRFD